MSNVARARKIERIMVRNRMCHGMKPISAATTRRTSFKSFRTEVSSAPATASYAVAQKIARKRPQTGRVALVYLGDSLEPPSLFAESKVTVKINKREKVDS
jgi:hypothetical protein